MKILIASFLLTEYLMIPLRILNIYLRLGFFKNPNKHTACWFRASELKIFAFKTDKVKLFNPGSTLESPGESISLFWFVACVLSADSWTLSQVT